MCNNTALPDLYRFVLVIEFVCQRSCTGDVGMLTINIVVSRISGGVGGGGEGAEGSQPKK